MEKSKTDFFLFFCSLSDAFAKLLESGDLKSSSVRLEGVNMPFHHLLARICLHHHFSGTFYIITFLGGPETCATSHAGNYNHQRGMFEKCINAG